MRRVNCLVAVFVLIFALSAFSTAWSSADDRRGTNMISGTITKIDGENITIKDGAGKLSTFRLPDEQSDRKIYPKVEIHTKVEAAPKVFPKVEATASRLKVGDKIKAQVQGKNITGMELAK